MGLLYGPGNITRQELALLDQPTAIGPWHHPVPFADFISDVSDSLVSHGATIVAEEYQTTHNDLRFFGAMQIAPANAESFLPGTGADLVVGLRGSHDKIVPRGICIGTRVMVCSNLCFDGNLANLKTRQTINVEDRLPIMIDTVISEVGKVAATNNTRIEAYRNHNLGTSQAGDAMLVELFRKEVMNVQQFQTAIAEWVEPSFETHQEDGQYTIWNLFNAVTQAFKPIGARAANQYNHTDLNRRSTMLVDSLDHTLGLAA